MDKKKATNAVVKEEQPAVVQAEDEGHIELVLRCLASMCDGQNTVLQVIIPGNAVISIKLSFSFSFQPLFRSLDTVRTEINSVPVVFLLGHCSHRN